MREEATTPSQVQPLGHLSVLPVDIDGALGSPVVPVLPESHLHSPASNDRTGTAADIDRTGLHSLNDQLIAARGPEMVPQVVGVAHLGVDHINAAKLCQRLFQLIPLDTLHINALHTPEVELMLETLYLMSHKLRAHTI